METCLICSDPLSPEAEEVQPPLKDVEEAMDKIRSQLLIPTTFLDKRILSFCEACIPLIAQVIALNNTLKIAELQVSDVSLSVGRRVLDSASKGNKRSKKWKKFQQPIIQNFEMGKLPNPFVRLTIDPTLAPPVAVDETLDMEVENTFKNNKGKSKKSPPTKESKDSENEASCSDDDLFSPILTKKKKLSPKETFKNAKRKLTLEPEEPETPPKLTKKSKADLSFNSDTKKQKRTLMTGSSKKRFSHPYQPLYGDSIVPSPVHVPKEEPQEVIEVENIPDFLKCPIDNCGEEFPLQVRNGKVKKSKKGKKLSVKSQKENAFSELTKHYATYHLNAAAKLSKKTLTLKCKSCVFSVKLNVTELSNIQNDIKAGTEIVQHFLLEHNQQFKTILDNSTDGTQKSPRVNHAKKNPNTSSSFFDISGEEEVPKKIGRQSQIVDYLAQVTTPTRVKQEPLSTPRRDVENKIKVEDSSEKEDVGRGSRKRPVKKASKKLKKKTTPKSKKSAEESESEIEEVSQPEEPEELPEEPVKKLEKNTKQTKTLNTRAGPKSKRIQKSLDDSEDEPLPTLSSHCNKEKDNLKDIPVTPKLEKIKVARPGPKSRKSTNNEFSEEEEPPITKTEQKPFGPKSKMVKNGNPTKLETVQTKLEARPRPGPKSKKIVPNDDNQLTRETIIKEGVKDLQKGKPKPGPKSKTRQDPPTTLKTEIISSKETTILSPSALTPIRLSSAFTSLLKENSVKSSSPSTPMPPSPTRKPSSGPRSSTPKSKINTAVVSFRANKELMQSFNKQLKANDPENNVEEPKTELLSFKEKEKLFNCPECNIPWSDGYEPFLEHLWNHKTPKEKEIALANPILMDIPRQLREKLIIKGHSPTAFRFSDALVAELILRGQFNSQPSQMLSISAGDGGEMNSALVKPNPSEGTSKLYVVLEKNYKKYLKCRDCNHSVPVERQSSVAERLLIIHFLQAHFKRSFICSICGQGFSEKRFLTRHYQICHEAIEEGAGPQLSITSS